MPPPTVKRMTANPLKPARHRPGKALREEESSSSDDSDSDGENDEKVKDESLRGPAPNTSSLPAYAKSYSTAPLASNLQNVDLNQRRKDAEARESKRRAQEFAERERLEKEAGFETASEEEESSEEDDDEEDTKPEAARLPSVKKEESSSEDEDEDSDEDSGSDSDDSSASSASSSPQKRTMPLLTFVPKSQRAQPAPSSHTDDNPATSHGTEILDGLVQDQVDAQNAAREAARRAWDDDEAGHAEEDVDDTDGLNPEQERKDWEVRELTRLRRPRAALEAAEAEAAEREGMTAEERAAENERRIAQQAAERSARPKMAALQKYAHKGGFYQDELGELADRDIMGATFQDQSANKEALPKHFQVRDSTMVGKKGQTRHRDLKTDDTGRFGDYGRDRRGARGQREGGGGGYADVEDERFRPDWAGGAAGDATGANARALGEKRKRGGDGAMGDEKRPRVEERA